MHVPDDKGAPGGAMKVHADARELRRSLHLLLQIHAKSVDFEHTKSPVYDPCFNSRVLAPTYVCAMLTISEILYSVIRA